jgi:hypothetical protein
MASVYAVTKGAVNSITRVLAKRAWPEADSGKRYQPGACSDRRLQSGGFQRKRFRGTDGEKYTSGPHRKRPTMSPTWPFFLPRTKPGGLQGRSLTRLAVGDKGKTNG